MDMEAIVASVEKITPCTRFVLEGLTNNAFPEKDSPEESLEWAFQGSATIIDCTLLAYTCNAILYTCTLF